VTFPQDRWLPPNAKFSGVAGVRGPQQPNETWPSGPTTAKTRDPATSAAMDVRRRFLR